MERINRYLSREWQKFATIMALNMSMRDRFVFFSVNTRKLLKEWQYRLSFPVLEDMKQRERFLFKYEGPDSIFPKMVVTSDSVIGGKSEALLAPSRNNKLLFYGQLNTTQPKDGETLYSGYCAMKSKQRYRSFNRKYHLDLTPFNYIEVRLRGDGRAYMVNISTENYYDYTWDDLYSFFLYTKGGPYWQTVKIPFSKFFLSSRGKIQDRQAAISLDKVNSVGLTLADKVNGPFYLEVDYIKVGIDVFHDEESAYEEKSRVVVSTESL